MNRFVRIHPSDNVAVALFPVGAGDTAPVDGAEIILREDVPQGHKMALRDISAGEKVIKYGFPIGRATRHIAAGEWVHTHNLVTGLTENGDYQYHPSAGVLPPVEPEWFPGFAREDGTVGIRNELWILPTVGCVNDVANRLAGENAHLAGTYGLDGVYAFPHPYGCSQMGDDHETTRRLLASLARHPNAGGVLVLGLGCENNTMASFRELLDGIPDKRVRFLVCQEVGDEIAEGARLLQELAAYAGETTRQPVPISRLVVGMKCGGSDGLSGITANPAVGAFSDMLIARGGSAILTEVPEMFGAEDLLMNRAVDREIFDKAVGMIHHFKHYFTSHGQAVYENPSPGNKQGGVSTLEDKSLGCVQKGGTAPVSDVIDYACRAGKAGLTLLCGPGNDLVSATALAAAGAHIILFTTGRGTPFGAPVPTLKIASNSALYKHKGNWIDFNAGTVAEGEPVRAAAERLLALVLETAGGSRTKSELAGYRDIAIFKNGVTL